VLAAASKGMQAVKLCSTKIPLFLSGGGQITRDDLYPLNSLFFQDNLGKQAPEKLNKVKPIWILMKT